MLNLAVEIILKSFQISTIDMKSCRHANALVANSSALEEAIAKATAFHIDGGNLKALQDYLDRQIQHSYEDYDLKFIPNTDKKNSPKVTHNVVTHLKEHTSKIIPCML